MDEDDYARQPSDDGYKEELHDHDKRTGQTTFSGGRGKSQNGKSPNRNLSEQKTGKSPNRKSPSSLRCKAGKSPNRKESQQNGPQQSELQNSKVSQQERVPTE